MCHLTYRISVKLRSPFLQEKTNSHKNKNKWQCEALIVDVRIEMKHRTRCVWQGKETRRKVEKWLGVRFFKNASFHTNWHWCFWPLISVRMKWPRVFERVVKTRPFKNIKRNPSHSCKKKKRRKSLWDAKKECEGKKAKVGFWSSQQLSSECRRFCCNSIDYFFQEARRTCTSLSIYLCMAFQKYVIWWKKFIFRD